MRHSEIAKRHVEKFLDGREEPISLFRVSCIADQAARGAGRKKDLFQSLWDYVEILPEGWHVRWLSWDGGTSREANCIPPGWQPGAEGARYADTTSMLKDA
jgi:hypothetical protein